MTLNNVKKTFTGQAFGDTAVFPAVLHDTESGIEAVINFDAEIKEYVLDINGEPFETLNYLVSDKKFTDKQDETIYAFVRINNNKKYVMRG